MKKIIILNWRDPKHPNAGGAEQATMMHALAWNKAGYDVTWFSSHVEGLDQKEKIQNINIIRKGYYVFGVQWAAYKYLSKNEFDLVVDQIHGLPFFTPLYINKNKILAYIHELSKEVVWHNPYPFPINKIIGMLAYFAEPLIYKTLYKNISFMTVSKSTKDELNKWGINKVNVIDNGVTIPKSVKKNKQSLLNKNKQKTLIYLGALAKDKGVFDAIEVFNRLSKKHKDWKFWIVGKGDNEIMKDLKQIANDNIKFLGYVDDLKKFELLSKAHLLVNPSIREGWGLVNIEANAVGTPVIGYDVAGVRDSIQNNKTGFLSSQKNIYKDIEKIFSNEEEYNEIVLNAVKWSKKFTWEKSTKESTELIKNIL